MSRIYPRLLSAVAALSLLLPLPALAHVKWFVEETAGPTAPVRDFSLAEPTVLLWIGVVLAGIAAALLLERLLPAPPQKMIDFACRHRGRILHLFQVMVGLALLIAAVQGAILAPHLEGSGGVALLLRFVQGGIGVLLIADKGVRVGAVLMMLLFAASALLFGFVSSLEYFNFLGIAVFLFLVSHPEANLDERLHPLALPLLRMHTGIALGVLAWTEKLSDPGLTVAFLEKHQINFMQAAGLDFYTDRLFALSAGATEMLFALIFILGLIPRLNTLALGGLMISSNLYFFVVGKSAEAFLELTGHLPLLAIALLFILYGGGRRLRLSNVLFKREQAPRSDDLCRDPRLGKPAAGPS